LDCEDIVSYEVERVNDELIIRSDIMWDVSKDYYELVMTVRQARKLAEVLLDSTLVMRMFADEENEDG
jgi:hypothetical protein